ncbi:MAG: hypothetical protein NZ853_02810 [Leptospiraceae bacterium]|nr:hypothetical protein [Leptospiraceae bacterium]MDW7975106.1 hypothetical protein [Leptospiraceae bacterium]
MNFLIGGIGRILLEKQWIPFLSVWRTIEESLLLSFGTKYKYKV